MTTATASQLKTWESYKQVAKRMNLETQALQKQTELLVLTVGFAQRNGKATNINLAQKIESAKSLVSKEQKLQHIIGAVETGDLGLRFRGGDFDIMAPADMSPDELAQYQLGSIHIIVAGILVAATAIAYMAYLRDKIAEEEAINSAIVDDVDALLCNDQNPELCTEWSQIKTQNRYMERRSFIDRLKAMANALPDFVTKAFGLAATVAGGIAIFYLVSLWRKNERN